MSANLQDLVGKILSDSKFAKALAENPRQTLEEAGIEPTVDLIDALEGVDAEALQKLATAFDDDQAAAA